MNMRQQQTDLIHSHFDEMWNRGRVEVLDNIVTPDYILSQMGTVMILGLSYNMLPGPHYTR